MARSQFSLAFRSWKNQKSTSTAQSGGICQQWVLCPSVIWELNEIFMHEPKTFSKIAERGKRSGPLPTLSSWRSLFLLISPYVL